MSSPYPCLQTMTLPESTVWEKEPPPALRSALETLYTPLQTTYPGMIRFARSKEHSSFLRFDHRWHLEDITSEIPQRSGPFSGHARAYTAGQPKELIDISGFCKITHLLDAYQMIQGHYPIAQHPALPAPGPKSAKVFSKLHDPHNQAYVDAVACYMLSKLRESGCSPHFSLFYGAYLAIAKQYYYNITEEFPEIRFENWFWKRQTQGIFQLVGYEGTTLLSKDDPLMEPPEDISDYTTVDSDSIRSLHDGDICESDDLRSIRSASISTTSDSEDVPANRTSSIESDLISELDENVTFYATLKEFPTLLMFLESSTHTMDSLLNDYRGPSYESHWTAWIFQVIAALCQIQSIWSMTHNDLHSNNILWSPTTDAFLYYKTNDGRHWKVPTYGKLFRIIDFGRAIYTHNQVLCISDDYLPDNEAGGQYNFGPLYDPTRPRVYPNPSFDLCRLSVSLFEALFDEIPDDKDGGCILSQEDSRIQRETVSPLFNSLWSWLIDEEGKNILWDESMNEKYPGFDLYRIIAQKVKNAIPREQLDKEPFNKFQLIDPITDTVKVYPLFC